jgi:Tol biopolymer transport system component
VGANREPAFSPDGRMLAYRATLGLSNQGGANLVIGVLTLESGDVREVVPKGLQFFNGLTWAPDGRSFAVAASDVGGRQGVYRVDAQTGTTEPIAVGTPGLFVGQFPKWSPDGKHIYYRRRSPTGTTVIERELSSGTERLMFPETRTGNQGFSVSPDGEWVAVITSDSVTKASLCLLAPVSGGPVKEVLRVNQPQSLQSNHVTWLADARGVIVRRQSAEGSELLVVPVTGATPVKLEVEASEITSPILSVHPDGKRLAYTAGGDSTEVWVLENFLPAAKRKP